MLLSLFTGFGLWWVLCCCQADQSERRLYFKRQDTCLAGLALSQDKCPDTVSTRTKTQCGAACTHRAGCLSFVWDPDNRTCQLCNTVVSDLCYNTSSTDNATSNTNTNNNTIPARIQRQQVFELRCLSPEERSVSEQCRCPPAMDGPRCQHRMTDCQDWRSAGFTGDSVRWIHPELSPQPFPITCQLTWKRGVILRRTTPDMNFYRKWSEYAEGFGDVSGDHWLGLTKLHQMTQVRCRRLGIQLNLANGTFHQLYYRNFTVHSENELFTIDFNPMSNNPNRKLGDCLSDVRQKPFSTYDADHDDDVRGSCAERHHSGWWFGSCTLCNPTGELTHPANVSRTSDREVFWTPGLGDILPESLFMVLLRC